MCTYYQNKIHNISLHKAVKMADFGISSANSKHALEKAIRPASTFYYHKLYTSSAQSDPVILVTLYRSH